MQCWGREEKKRKARKEKCLVLRRLLWLVIHLEGSLRASIGGKLPELLVMSLVWAERAESNLPGKDGTENTSENWKPLLGFS